MINVVDRVPTKPNRIKLTHEDGSTEYVTWERADEPTVAGTPINKALFDSIKADLPLTSGVTKYVSTVGSDTTGNGTEAAPFASIQAAINSIPRNLGGFAATINIAPGIYPEYLQVNNYHGGVLNIGTNATTGVTINGIAVHNSQYVLLNANTIEFNQANVKNTTMVSVSYGSLVFVNQELVLNNAIDSGVHSIYVAAGGRLISQTYAITINNSSKHALYVANGMVYVPRLRGTNNQEFAVYCVAGGVVSYWESPITSVLGQSTTSGGRIFGGGQTSIPQY